MAARDDPDVALSFGVLSIRRSPAALSRTRERAERARSSTVARSSAPATGQAIASDRTHPFHPSSFEFESTPPSRPDESTQVVPLWIGGWDSGRFGPVSWPGSLRRRGHGVPTPMWRRRSARLRGGRRRPAHARGARAATGTPPRRTATGGHGGEPKRWRPRRRHRRRSRRSSAPGCRAAPRRPSRRGPAFGGLLVDCAGTQGPYGAVVPVGPSGPAPGDGVACGVRSAALSMARLRLLGRLPEGGPALS